MRLSTHDDSFISCFHNKILSGNIDCKTSCAAESVAYGSSTANTIYFCEDSSLDVINEHIRPNRRSCIFKQMAFQFSDICDETQSHSDGISNAAFKWYKDKYEASTNWRTTDCPNLQSTTKK
eukprot:TRINITY_DN4873_c0_g1_i1.p1 TRINITY_DN4873_c0_g1~~TRINITY_DN4873_c0_g1_i1.p1  ORF type:complete len:122 (+),score=13.07 TRINITY_DN4873_c0_g1_i1:28-393(+)